MNSLIITGYCYHELIIRYIQVSQGAQVIPHFPSHPENRKAKHASFISLYHYVIPQQILFIWKIVCVLVWVLVWQNINAYTVVKINDNWLPFITEETQSFKETLTHVPFFVSLVTVFHILVHALCCNTLYFALIENRYISYKLVIRSENFLKDSLTAGISQYCRILCSDRW